MNPETMSIFFSFVLAEYTLFIMVFLLAYFWQHSRKKEVENKSLKKQFESEERYEYNCEPPDSPKWRKWK